MKKALNYLRQIGQWPFKVVVWLLLGIVFILVITPMRLFVKKEKANWSFPNNELFEKDQSKFMW